MNRSKQVWQVMAAVLLMMIALMPMACAEQAEETTETETIAPATPEPNVNLEDDPALTQTLDPGENRSPYEGGPLQDDEVIGGDATDDSAAPPDDVER